MGTSMSASRVWGVPMPPTARALVAVWSEVWEAPRFGGQAQVALRREAVAPLLRIAASCAAALQAHVAPASRKSKLPPQGASRELLVTALDFGCEEAGLPQPAEAPAAFVRALVRACFMTGDGDLVEGLTEEGFERLLAEHCPKQLELAAALVGDAGGALREALNAASARVAEVLAAPAPPPGDLAGAAGRLLLAQRLERIAEEAAELLAAEAAPQAAMEVEEPGAAEAVEVVEVVEPAEADVPMDAEDQGLERSETVAAPKPSDADAGAAEMPRTRSQIASSVKVQKVQKDLDEKREPIHELRRAASQLARRSVPEDAELEALESELQVVEQARKRARNFHEDLLEDMLCLDNLSNLAAEDRSVRKASLAGIEALLEDVDAAKARLGALHKALQEKRDAAVQAKLKAEAAAEAAAAAAAAEATRPAPKRAAVDTSIEAPPPQREDWQRVRLPLRFHSREEADHYTILATIPGLDTEELRLELSQDGSRLTVAGLRAPTAQEAAWMQQKITSRLRALARQAPQKLPALRQDVDRIASRAYVELGQGEFGRFSETFRVPEDVDAEGIDASYTDGVLRVVLPKAAAPAPQGPWFDNGRANYGRHRGAPMGYPMRSPGRGPSAADLFGGLDGNYYW